MYDIVPKPLVESETNDDGNTILLKPKFRNTFLSNYLTSRVKKPFFKVTLDEIGTFIWSKIDGKHNAVEISDKLSAEFGEKIQPANERLGLFLGMLKRGKFVDF